MSLEGVNVQIKVHVAWEQRVKTPDPGCTHLRSKVVKSIVAFDKRF